MGFRTWIKGWLERRKIQSWVELEESQIHHSVLRYQLEIAKLTLREMKKSEGVQRRIRKRNPERYIC